MCALQFPVKADSRTFWAYLALVLASHPLLAQLGLEVLRCISLDKGCFKAVVRPLRFKSLSLPERNWWVNNPPHPPFERFPGWELNPAQSSTGLWGWPAPVTPRANIKATKTMFK